jgi:hypothetical protein
MATPLAIRQSVDIFDREYWRTWTWPEYRNALIEADVGVSHAAM